MKVRQAEFAAEKKEILRSGRVQQNCQWQWTDWDDEGKCASAARTYRREVAAPPRLPRGSSVETS